MEKTERKKSRVNPKLEPGSANIESRAGGRAAFDSLDIRLNPNTARQAIILSEIIGKPLSKRKRAR